MRSLSVALLLASFVLGAVFGSSAAAAPPSLKKQVQLALTEYRSGMRHEDGELTCSRMTLRFRREVLSAAADEGTAGLGCVTLIELFGREVYLDMKGVGSRVDSVERTVRNGARARTPTGDIFCLRRVDRRWRIDSTDDSCRLRPLLVEPHLSQNRR